HANLVHDYLSRKSHCDAAIVSNTIRISLIAGNAPAIATCTIVDGKKMAASRNHCASGDCNARANAAGAARSSDPPATHVDCGVAVVVKLDELIAGAAWTPSAELADD